MADHSLFVRTMRRAIVALSGYRGSGRAGSQYRVFGAAAGSVCGSAVGLVDAFIDCALQSPRPVVLPGLLLICQEAGAGPVQELR